MDRLEMRDALRFFYPQDEDAAWRSHPGWHALGLNGTDWDIDNDDDWSDFAGKVFRLEGEQGVVVRRCRLTSC